MKAEELMLGDWFKTTYPNGVAYRKVTSIYENGYVSCKECVTNAIEPIPLTPEILVKNGVEEEIREGDTTVPYSAFILDEKENHFEITWYDSHDKYEPNTGEYLGGVPEVWTCELSVKGNYIDIQRNKLYVHQLQHALRLCGVDKNIEL